VTSLGFNKGVAGITFSDEHTLNSALFFVSRAVLFGDRGLAICQSKHKHDPLYASQVLTRSYKVSFSEKEGGRGDTIPSWRQTS
jgi:hypothetical protein